MVRGGSRTAATSSMERFVIIVNGFQLLTIITKRSILDVTTVLDPPLVVAIEEFFSWRITLSKAPVFTKKHLNTSRMMYLFFATQETKSTITIRDVSVG